MSEDLVESLSKLFVGFRGAYGTHGVPVRRDTDGKWTIRNTATLVHRPVTIDLWRRHVSGAQPLGVAPINEESECCWGSIDYDVYSDDLTDMLRRVEALKVPLVPCRSKSGGLHLFVFLSEPVPARMVREVLESLSARLGAAGAEIFPKQSQILLDRGDLASWMIMPYFGSTYDGKIMEQVGLRPTGAELTLGEFVRTATRSKMTPDQLGEIASKSWRTSPAGGGGSGGTRGAEGSAEDPADEPFSDGPPCLRHLAGLGGVGSGGNNMLLMMGIYYQKKYQGSWEAHLEEANRTWCSPPRTSDEVQSLIRSLKKKEYNYTCRTEPMASHCHSRLCRGKKYGVGDGGEVPRIGGLVALLTDPVIWFVDVDGERLELETTVLQVYTKFHAACMEKLQRCYQPIKQSDWLTLVNSAMASVVSVQPAPDSRPGATLHELVEEFLTNRGRGSRQEDLLSGRPWENDEKKRYEFRMRDLQAFLEREGHEETARGKLARQIEKWGGGHEFYNLAGKGVNFWWLPVEAVERPGRVSTPPVLGSEDEVI